jgi:hypothetical protein
METLNAYAELTQFHLDSGFFLTLALGLPPLSINGSLPSSALCDEHSLPPLLRLILAPRFFFCLLRQSGQLRLQLALLPIGPLLLLDELAHLSFLLAPRLLCRATVGLELLPDRIRDSSIALGVG